MCALDADAHLNGNTRTTVTAVVKSWHGIY